MKKNSVSEFEMEKQDFKIRLKRGGAVAPIVQLEEPQPLAYAPVVSVTGGQPPAQIPVSTPAATNEVDIKSPMIGTFYRSPSPEAGPYVEVGSEVGPDTVVGIIQVIKVIT